MFPFPKKPYTPKTPLPRWVPLAALALIVLAIAMNRLNHKETPPPSTETPATAAQLPDWNTYTSLVFPNQKKLRIRDMKEGEGAAARCGEEVALRYTLLNGDNTMKVADQSTRFRIGEGKALEALEQAAPGMKQGGVRRAVTGEGEIYELTLDTILTPPSPKNSMELRIFEGTRRGGTHATCGTALKLHITLWSTEGVKLFSTRSSDPVTLTPGHGESMSGIEQGALGMTPGSIRTLLIPPHAQRPLGNASKTLPKPLTQPTSRVVMADIELISIPAP